MLHTLATGPTPGTRTHQRTWPGRLHGPWLAFVIMASCLGGCGSERKKLRPKLPVSRTEEQMSSIARQNQIEPRILLVAAHSQSAFGQPSDGALAESIGRASFFAMPVATTGPIGGNDVVANTRLLASKMSDIARASPPKDPFDWLVIAANIIVGQTTDDPNTRDLGLRTALLDLVTGYNQGFSATSGLDTIRLPPLPESQQIQAAKLDERQIQYINGFRLRKDFGSDFYLAGPDVGPVIEKDAAKIPNLLVIWCPGSNLVCFDHFRANKTTPVHFLATRSLDGQMETTQFYPVAQDLPWHGKILKNTTLLAISGLAGRARENYRPDWLLFPEYSSLRSIVRNIFDQTVRKFLGAQEADKLLADPATFRKYVVPYVGTKLTPIGTEFPEGSLDYSLPVFWDQALFQEILEAERPPRVKEQLVVLSPVIAEDFVSTDVPFKILLSDDVRQIEIFQDRVVTQPKQSPWDLILKREVDPAERKTETFTHPFTRPGALVPPHRAVKILARGQSGEIVASTIIRFQVRPIKAPE